MWRYATLGVLRKMHRKLLFNNLSIVWNIKVLWPISQDSAQFSESVVIRFLNV